MKSYDPHMMSILYAPAYYAHASYFPQELDNNGVFDLRMRSFWLIKQRKLSHLSTDWQSDDDTLSQLFNYWYLVPIVAHLVGGYLQRNKLLHKADLLMSEPKFLAFISLPLPHHISWSDIDYGTVDHLPCGIAFILSQFPKLPQALRERLLLHFPLGMSYPQFSAAKTLNHNNLLRMALTYAHHYYQ